MLTETAADDAAVRDHPTDDLAAAAELIRRRPATGHPLAGPARMPEQYLASAGDEVRWALAETRHAG